ncbi:MAG: hypothetical protein A2X08_11600 [Bacteroidetes bacterium GWA2_32_17]|nr:MAG: hypothetical protein A2X08_11600 [Bacteroidetes bacterium GWA2_32_17]
MLRNYKILIKRILKFSRWSRKAYAVFISIGKIVNISNLKIEVSQDFIKKSKGYSEVQSFFNLNSNTKKEFPPNIDKLTIYDILLSNLLFVDNHINSISTKQYIFKKYY